MRSFLARLFRRPRGGIIPPRRPDDDSVLVRLSPDRHVTDPDEAEELGWNVEAKLMRHPGNAGVRCDCCVYQHD